jgi:hypothetical protein
MQDNVDFNNFCSVCEYLLCNVKAELEHAKEVIWGYHNLRELQQSAAEGCHLCRLVHGCFDEDTLDELQTDLLHLPYLGDYPLRLEATIDPYRHISLQIKHPEALGQAPTARLDSDSKLMELLENVPSLSVVNRPRYGCYSQARIL